MAVSLSRAFVVQQSNLKTFARLELPMRELKGLLLTLLTSSICDEEEFCLRKKNGMQHCMAFFAHREKEATLGK